MSSSTRALLVQVVADLDRVLSDDALAGLSDGDRVEVLQAAGAAFRRAEAVVVETVATGDLGDFPHAAGCRGTNELVQRMLRVDVGGAGRVVRAVDAVRRDVSLVSGERLPARWPELRAAMLDGVIGVAGLLAATRPIEKVWDRISVDQRLAADVALAGCARGHGIEYPDNPDVDADEDGPGPSPTVEDLKALAEDLAAMFDPDGVEPEDESARRRRGVTIGRLTEGVHAIRGYLTAEVAAQLQLIFDAILNPKGNGAPMPGVTFTPSRSSDGNDADMHAEADAGADAGAYSGAGADSDSDSGADADADPFNSDERAVIDDRTAAQKRHDALAAALGIAARHRDMPTLGGASPTVVVTVDAKDLAHASGSVAFAPGSTGEESGFGAFGSTGGVGSTGGFGAGVSVGSRGSRGPGWATLPGSGARVPVSVAAQIACTGAIQRVLFDEGRIIGITTTDRVFTVYQRRAIIARDKECLIPGCHVPASWCEIHHVTEHARGGPTHTDNGVPLCWWHHRSLGKSGWEIRMHNGTPQIRGPRWWDPAQQWRTPRLSLHTTPTTPARHAKPAPPLARTG